jgi:hypothetical protein
MFSISQIRVRRLAGFPISLHDKGHVMVLSEIGNKSRLVIVAIGIASLAACGGGGSNTSAASTSATPVPTASTSTAPAPVASTSTASVSTAPLLSAKPTAVSALGTFGVPVWPNGNAAAGGQGAPIADVNCAKSEEYHIHSHLTIIRDGQPLAIPANAGIVPGCTYDLHTHDSTGIIHVESPAPRRFTLGQFFAVWGQPLSLSNVAGLTGQPIAVYINDAGNFRQYTGDPREIEFAAHREITFVVGAAPSEIPAFVWDIY